MIEICINKKLFDKSLGYGSWGFITIGIVFVLIASSLELSTRHLETHGIVEYLCYQSITWNKDICNNYYDDTTSTRFYGSIISLIIDLSFIWYWINHKKNLVKLKWCSEQQNQTEVIN